MRKIYLMTLMWLFAGTAAMTQPRYSNEEEGYSLGFEFISFDTNTNTGTVRLRHIGIDEEKTSVNIEIPSMLTDTNERGETMYMTVTEIGSTVVGSPFLGDGKIASVKIPSTVEKILNGFDVPTLTIPATVKEIRDAAFEGCKRLQSVTIPDGVEIGSGVFSGCTSLNSVKLPNGLKEISAGMFDGCTALRNFDIPSTVGIIGVGAFYGSGLEHVTIPASVYEIKHGAFRNCNSLSVIEFNEQTLSSPWLVIEGMAFAGTPVQQVVIPYYARLSRTINHPVFEGCNQLRSLRVSEGVYHNVFSPKGSNVITGMTWGGSYDDWQILEAAAYDVNIPSDERELAAGCLSSLQDETIVFPANVSKFNGNPFEGHASTYNLKAIYSLNPTPPVGSSVSIFPAAVKVKKVTLYVPAGAKGAYEKAAIWKGFKTIKEMNVPDTISEAKSVDLQATGTAESLANTVVDGVLYTLGDGDGYNSSEQCLTVNSTMTDEAVEAAATSEFLPGTEEFAQLFSGIVIGLEPGSGTIQLDAQTAGGYALKIKVGGLEAQAFTKTAKGQISIPYTCEQHSYAYLYASAPAASARRQTSAADGNVKIYSLSIRPDEEGMAVRPVTAVAGAATEDSHWYLPSGQRIKGKPTKPGLYISKGRKHIVTTAK